MHQFPAINSFFKWKSGQHLCKHLIKVKSYRLKNFIYKNSFVTNYTTMWLWVTCEYHKNSQYFIVFAHSLNSFIYPNKNIMNSAHAVIKKLTSNKLTDISKILLKIMHASYQAHLLQLFFQDMYILREIGHEEIFCPHLVNLIIRKHFAYF